MGLLDSLKELISQAETPPVAVVVPETPPVAVGARDPARGARRPRSRGTGDSQPLDGYRRAPGGTRTRGHRSGNHHPSSWRRDVRGADRRGDVHGDDSARPSGPGDQERPNVDGPASGAGNRHQVT